MIRPARSVGLLVALVVLSGATAGAAHSATQADVPLLSWDTASLSVEEGVEGSVAGRVAGDDLEVVVEKQAGQAWTALPTKRDGDRFSAKVAGETAIYRAVAVGTTGTSVSDEATVRAVAARSDLTIRMPGSAADRTRVTVDVGWRRTADGVPMTGTVDLQLRRRGDTTWRSYHPVVVTDGVGRLALTPRDDGQFRLQWAGDSSRRPVTSSPQSFDNVPTDVLRMRIGQYNLPGEDKLPHPTKRVPRAVAAIKSADLDVVTFNELVGPGHDSTGNPPSSFARSVITGLGPRWRLLTPTMTYNENYIAYRPDRMELIAQHPDRVVPGIGTGEAQQVTSRHVTPVLLKDLGSNRPVLVVGTHLVNGDRAGARKQAYDVGALATALSDGYPVVVAGDMNTSDRLTGLEQIRLKDARRAATRRTGSSYATYVKYSRKKPVKDARAIIDQVYVPQRWKVSRWTTVLGTKHGSFTTPRPSDHLLVWASLVGSRP
jgi:endonuclease/exonuclease/phosphatase family metal-dependent hydrolase